MTHNYSYYQLFLTILLTVVAFDWTSAQLQRRRFCVPESKSSSCPQLARDTGLHCVLARDKVDCILKIVNGDADIGVFQPEELFIASKYLDNKLKVIKEIRTNKEENDQFRYEAVSVVRNSLQIRSLADLSGKLSCHTGYARNAGWNFPTSLLMAKNVIPKRCSSDKSALENEIATIAAFFQQACVAGEWALDPKLDRELKQKYSNLCALCDHPSECSNKDIYYGYTGTLRCISKGRGEIAWTKLPKVKEYFGLDGSLRQADPNIFSFLCPDGSRLPLTHPKPCTWAGRPWPGFAVSSDLPNDQVFDIQTILTKARGKAISEGQGQADLRFKWFSDILEYSGDFMNEYDHRYPILARDYVGNGHFNVSIEKWSCPEQAPIKWCTTSEKEQDKCKSLRMAAYSRRIRPEITCDHSSNSAIGCMEKIKNGEADVIALDGGEVYTAGKEHGLIPILTEVHDDHDATYFAVAVVKASSGIQSFQDLKGKKSCHTGIGRTAGWNVPASFLMEKGLIKMDGCAIPKEIGNFFSESCVPGAKSPEYDTRHDNPDSLCELCAGEDIVHGSRPETTYRRGSQGAPESSKCAYGAEEAFSGYTGAFRCLVEGGGDVAFVKHATALQNTDGNNNASWGINLRSSNYRLLCPAGGTAPVQEFKACNLARVPSHKYVTNPDKSKAAKEDIVHCLLDVADTFTTDQTHFRFFGSFEGQSDLLSKDSATDLHPLPEGSTYQTVLDTTYLTMMSEIHCASGSTRSASSSTLVQTATTSLFTLLVAGFLRRLR